ncbi:PFU domain-containing protein [Encephalitozoon hellem]|nr:PFU domain-containing protein [Encephalitozoon hellem]
MIGIERIEKISTSDVKTLLVEDDMVVSGGREGKIRVCGHDFSRYTEIEPGQGYVNCVAIGGEFLFAGCQNGSIVVYSLDECRLRDGHKEEGAKVVPVGFLKGHSSNVCCLDTMGDFIVSSSWDCTVIVWEPRKMNNDKGGMVQKMPHPTVVWCAKFINENTIVTGCSDKLIRIFKNGVLTRTFNHHLSYVRGVAVLNENIFSIDNEGIVLKVSLDGRILKHYSTKNFMYSIFSYTCDGKGLVICTGENGTAIVFDEGLKPIQSLSVPVTSCWAGFGWNGKVYVGGSDGRLYVYSSNPSSEATKAIEEMRNEQGSLLKDGEFVSDGQKFKAANGNVYQEVNGEWVLLGKGEGAKPYDNTFQVELENKYYTLSFNNNENVYEVAEKFLRENRLRDEFRDDIVDFINKNFVSAKEFRIYSRINTEGVKSMLNKIKDEHQYAYPHILDNLQNPSIDDNDKVEEEIRMLINSGPKFMALDLIRYFMVHKYIFDLSFLFTFTPRDKKEAVTFVRLLSNLFADPPFNLDALHPRVLELKDRGIVDGEVLDDYFVNKSLRSGA